MSKSYRVILFSAMLTVACGQVKFNGKNASTSAPSDATAASSGKAVADSTSNTDAKAAADAKSKTDAEKAPVDAAKALKYANLKTGLYSLSGAPGVYWIDVTILSESCKLPDASAVQIFYPVSQQSVSNISASLLTPLSISNTCKYKAIPYGYFATAGSVNYFFSDGAKFYCDLKTPVANAPAGIANYTFDIKSSVSQSVKTQCSPIPIGVFSDGSNYYYSNGINGYCKYDTDLLDGDDGKLGASVVRDAKSNNVVMKLAPEFASLTYFTNQPDERGYCRNPKPGESVTIPITIPMAVGFILQPATDNVVFYSDAKTICRYGPNETSAEVIADMTNRTKLPFSGTCPL